MTNSGPTPRPAGRQLKLHRKEKAGRLERSRPACGFQTSRSSYLGGLRANYLLQPQSELSLPQSLPQPQLGSQQLFGQQTVTVTGTCLHTQCGTQRVTVYGTQRGTHLLTWIVRW
jgi:hypothetical protein